MYSMISHMTIRELRLNINIVAGDSYKISRKPNWRKRMVGSSKDYVFAFLVINTTRVFVCWQNYVPN